MKRLTPSIAAAIALMAVPASSATAQTQRGAVLRVDRGHHRVEIVDAQHAVRSYAAPRGAARQVDVTYYAEALTTARTTSTPSAP